MAALKIDGKIVWPKREYSKSQIDRSGAALAAAETPDREAFDYQVLSNWRAAHGYPLNTFQVTLRHKLAQIDPEAIVAQRLKRAPTIIDKIRRSEASGGGRMSLIRMQDIGGL